MPAKRGSISSFLVVFVLVLSTVSFAQDSTEVQLQTEKLTDNLYTIQDTGGMGNTTVLTGKDGGLMIDTKAAASVGLLLIEIGKLCPEPVRFAVITHWHHDHVGGNETVADAGATLIAHENVRKQMGVAHDMKLLGAEVPASPEIAKPMVTYTDGLVFHMNGEEVAVFHLGAGHTDGDSVIFFRNANVIHMGDLYFEGLYPYIGIYSGGTIDGMIQRVTDILGMTDGNTKVVPGHGPVSDRNGLQQYLAMLIGVRDNVRRLMQAGKTLEEVVAAKPTREFDEKWGGGFLSPDRFTSLVYMDLSPDLP